MADFCKTNLGHLTEPGRNMGHMRKSQPTLKQLKFRSLTEIMGMAIHTGEHLLPPDPKNPLKPREANPAFRDEVHEIIDDIFADEIAEIHHVAEVEREILRRDIEIARQKLLRDIEQAYAEQMKKIEIEIRKIFQETADRAEARAKAAAEVETLKSVADPVFAKNSAAFEESRRPSHIRMGQMFKNIYDRIFNPG